MLKVGLTGGIGSGKTVVACIFSRLGIPVFVADTEAARITNSEPGVKEKLKQLFGPEVIGEQGLPDRKRLREQLFRDPDKREVVQKLIHPLVQERFVNWCSGQKEVPFVLEEAAILFESGADAGLDSVILVTAPVALRLQRTMKRDRAGEEEVRAIMAAQSDDETKAGRCDFIIVNDEKQLLIPQVLKVYDRLQKAAAGGVHDV